MAFPTDFQTQRLSAEQLRVEHWDELHAMHQDAVQMEPLGGIRSAEETTAYLARTAAHWEKHGFGLWLLRSRDTGDVAGRALLRYLTLDNVEEVEVGYSLHPSFWGQGLATEIAAACVTHGLTSLGLSSIVALTRPVNLRSQRVLSKIGMLLERELVHDHQAHLLYRTAPEPLRSGDTA